jgi:hypothetical protein
VEQSPPDVVVGEKVLAGEGEQILGELGAERWIEG